MENKKGKVLVGLSGGVDSSVSAALLKAEGYDVTGVFIKVWQADFLPCSWREERRDAMRAAAHLGIPFMTLDLEKEYKKDVVDYMIAEYSAGRVPNPDVMCNKYVKFGGFLDFARTHGAHFVATGHYAQVTHTGAGKEEIHLARGEDTAKDQSYFLWTLTQVQLSHILFPVGHLQKSAVRRLAQEFGLPNADKKDSQGLCFMGAVDMPNFLKHYLHTSTGDVLDEAGNVIGSHEGAILYAIGQRRGFTTQKHGDAELPYHVIAKDIQKNTITVSHRDLAHKSIATTHLHMRNINLIHPIDLSVINDLVVELRYHGEKFPASLEIGKDDRGTATLSVGVEGISSGQSIVFYSGNECLGGGIIA